MTDFAVSVRGLGKQYHLGAARERYSTLRDSINKFTSAPLRRLLRRATAAEKNPPFWALKDVSFDVKRGEVVGIIGRNGAGKSTLLKILSRITEPTEGEADIYGRVGSLLEVGTGFHPELTGRENVYLNGAILGMRRSEIARKFDEIVAFAEVEKFIDTPVKHYSSGMYMRLAFAVAAHLEPEVLIVDEVLAVGDAQFQKKCLGKMGDVARGGRTVLFVSHNMAAVQNLCGHGLLLEKGQAKCVGTAVEAVQQYLKASQSADRQFNPTGRRMQPSAVEIVDAWIEKDGLRTTALLYDDRAEVIIKLVVRDCIRYSVELLLRQQDGLPVAFAPSGLARGWEVSGVPGEATIRCRLPAARYASGQFSIDLIAAVSGTQFLDYIESGLTFEIESAAVGPRNWAFRQAGGQGCAVWDVAFEVADSAS